MSDKRVVSNRSDGRPAVRVLWVIKGLALGGAERLLLSFAQAADRDGNHYEVAYVLPALSTLAPELEVAGVPTRALGGRSHMDLRWMFRLRRLLRHQPFDVVHLHLPYAGGLAGIVVWSLLPSRRPKVVYTQHSVWKGMALAIRPLVWCTAQSADALIAVSNVAHRSMPARLRRRTEVIVHGVVLEAVRAEARDREATRAELGIGDAEVLVTAVANFRPEKGHDILLRAVRDLVDRGVRARFAVVGHGPMEDEIRDLRDRLGLKDIVDLLGFRNDAIRILGATDVFVLPSLHEGFPVSVMEALAVGVPVVATAVGGVPEAITDGVEGSVVPPGRPDLLADALERIVKDTAFRERAAAAARRRGAEYDISVAVRRIELLYRELAGTG